MDYQTALRAQLDREDLEELGRAAEKWIYGTLQAMVDDEISVVVLTTVKDTGIDFDVRVAKADLGSVIGKQGRIARSLRTLLYARGGKDGVRYGCSFSERQHESLVDEVGFSGQAMQDVTALIDKHEKGGAL